MTNLTGYQKKNPFRKKGRTKDERLENGIRIRLAKNTMDRLRHMSSQQSIPISIIARMLIVKALEGTDEDMIVPEVVLDKYKWEDSATGEDMLKVKVESLVRKYGKITHTQLIRRLWRYGSAKELRSIVVVLLKRSEIREDIKNGQRIYYSIDGYIKEARKNLLSV